MSNLYLVPQLVDIKGGSANGTAEFYVNGTTTPLEVFEDDELSSSLGAVISADGKGLFAPIYTDADVFRVTRKVDGVVVDSIDDIKPGGGGSVTSGALDGAVSLKSFGSLGTGGTSSDADTQALNDAIEFVLSSKSINEQSGGRIYIPPGIYVFKDTLDINIDNVLTNPVQLIGAGAYLGQSLTQLVFSPTTEKDGIVLRSTQNFYAEGIEFIVGNNNVRHLLNVEGQPSPLFSGFMGHFKHCTFRNYSGVSSTEQYIRLTNAVLFEFEKCWFAGLNNTLLLGEVTPDTEGQGGVGSIIFNQCQIYCDIEVGNCEQSLYQSCVFARKNVTTPVKIYPSATGFFRNNRVKISNCARIVLVDGVIVDFFTQGASSEGFIAENNRLEGYRKTFVLNGKGPVSLTANSYTPPINVDPVIGVEIGPSITVAEINDDFSTLQTAGHIAVVDNRVDTIYPMVVNASVGTDRVFQDVGSFEIVLFQNVRIVAGQYEVAWAANIRDGNSVDGTNASGANYIIRVEVDGQSQTLAAGSTFVDSGETQLIRGGGVIKLPNKSDVVTVALKIRQGAGNPSTLEAADVSYSSFLQLKKI